MVSSSAWLPRGEASVKSKYLATMLTARPQIGEKGSKRGSNQVLINYRSVARVLAWIGIVTIIVLSVVPADDRPVTGAGHLTEHFAAFAPVAVAFAIGYCRLSLLRLVLLAFLFCGGVELLQIPLPTRHARGTDFIIDLFTACSAIAITLAVERFLAKSARNVA